MSNFNNSKKITIMVDYREFLKLPEIEEAFNDMFEERKKYFRDKSLYNTGLNKESLEVICIKMSFIATDLYFTQIHKSKYRELG